MILQCEQCKTRFRLDDSKLKPGGVKVRCSKCRHVFIAGTEPAHEESEFDAVLSGLGGAAAAAEPAVEPAAPAAFDVGAAAEPAAPPAAEEPPASEEFPEFGEGPFAEEAAHPAEPAVDFDPFASLAETGEPEPAAKTAEAGAADVDFGAFAEPAPAETKPAEEPAEFGEFSFGEEPAVAATAEPAPAATEAEVDFGAFSFEEPAAAAEAAAPAAVEDALDFSAFSLDEPAAATVTPPPAEEPAGFGLQEFSFEEPAAPPEAEQPAPAEGPVFGEFSFEEAAPEAETPSQPAASSETAGGFQEFSFEEEPAPSSEPAAQGAPVDFGEFSFEEAAPAETAPRAPAEEPGLESFAFEEPAPEAPSTPDAAESALDFGEFSFESAPAAESQESAAPPAAAPTDGFGDFSFQEPSAAPAPAAESAVSPAQPPEEGAPHPEGESLDFGDFSFDQDLFKADAGKEPATSSPSSAGKEGTAPGAGERTSVMAAGIAEVPSVEADEIPPFPVSSRRRGRSALTVSLVAVCVVMVVALSGIGFYVMQSGPAAFDKLGIGFVGKWFGVESPEEGRINISNTQASFHQNKEGGELFVVRGRAVNTFKKARASIHIKVTLYDKGGRPILQKTAYCGNKLTDDQLATLPMAKIDSVMNNQFGDSLANMGVAPDKSIPFVVAIGNVPKEAADFGVESIGSTVSGP